MLKANCEQVAQMVSDITGKSPGDAASYEDLWRFTLTNYHAGPGCLSNALRSTWVEKAPLDWNNVSMRLDAGCDSALNFVDRVINPIEYFTPTPPVYIAQGPTEYPVSLQPGTTQTATATITVVPTGTVPGPSPTPSPTISPTISPASPTPTETQEMSPSSEPTKE
jgi:hypothetical protein